MSRKGQQRDMDQAAGRPKPPASVLDITGPAFSPAPDVAEWMRATFIEEESWLENPDHTHLRHATFGVLWAAVLNQRQGRRIIGQAETGGPRGALGRWAKARVEQQVQEWFGQVPDFVLTFDAAYCADCPDVEFCALVEHELYHCAQALDDFGMPKFNRETGRPVFTMRGHDVEEFVGVVRRYGAEATGTQALVEAANEGPTISRVRIGHACGTCSLRLVG